MKNQEMRNRHPKQPILHCLPSRIKPSCIKLLFAYITTLAVAIYIVQMYGISSSNEAFHVVFEKSSVRGALKTSHYMLGRLSCNHPSVVFLCSESVSSVCSEKLQIPSFDIVPESQREEYDDVSNVTITLVKKTERERIVHVGGDCRPAKLWQTDPRPACNVVHEIDLMNVDVESSRRNVNHSDATTRVTPLGHGGTRIVWKVSGSYIESTGFVLKTLKLGKKFDQINLDKQRRDAVALDELTNSPNVVNVYAYCAQTAINEIGVKDLNGVKIFFQTHGNYTSLTKLKLAKDVANAVADLQEIDKEMGPLMVHNDIGPANMLIMPDGRLKLNDFNGAHMIYWDYDNNSTCGYRDKKFCGEDHRRVDTRSPEECLGNMLSEKLDTYSIGTILFFILTNERMYHSHEEDKKFSSDTALLREVIRKGQEPRLPLTIEESNNTAIVAIRTAMRQALTHDSVKRPTARNIATLLDQALKKIRVEAPVINS